MMPQDIRLALSDIISGTYKYDIKWYKSGNIYTANRGAVRLVLTDAREVCTVCGAFLPDYGYCGATESDHVPGSVQLVVKYPTEATQCTVVVPADDELKERVAAIVTLRAQESVRHWPPCRSLTAALARFQS